MIKIETGIPIPTRDDGKRPSYPFREMNVGDSFTAARDVQIKVIGAAKVFKHRNPGWDFAKRRTEDGGVRIWRIA